MSTTPPPVSPWPPVPPDTSATPAPNVPPPTSGSTPLAIQAQPAQPVAGPSPVGEIVSTILNAIPSGWGTSEAKLIVAASTFLGALVTVFDILMGTGVFPGVPGAWVGGVDAGYAAFLAYVTSNYAHARAQVKAAALAVAAPTPPTGGQ